MGKFYVFCGNFDRFFADLRKNRENLKLNGEVCSRNKDKFIVEFKEDESYMGVDLLKHNQEAYEKVQKAIKEGVQGQCLTQTHTHTN